MTASAPLPPPPSHPPAPATGLRAPSRWLAPCVAAVVAAGAGIGIGWLLWAGPDSAAAGTGVDNAAADAAGACQAWKRVPSLDAVFSDDNDDRISHYDRAGGAAALAASAARLDSRYDALGKAFQNVSTRMQTFDVKGAEAVAAEKKVDALCADRDG
ncbi:hypothetical protein [Streptomyces prasinopilosus]|uniref:Uncharacterized protein n=2 Tax=Streptomyces prasinopilosus TaxID=67344 RepID=A0A1G6MF58_9ACTN|nr:hypothetical protein [Streptomyces prasinopilosus]SDC54258.1 hypothetical protein SAMN05216505_102518 [Streptomyces prasinopilosus]